MAENGKTAPKTATVQNNQSPSFDRYLNKYDAQESSPLRNSDQPEEEYANEQLELGRHSSSIPLKQREPSKLKNSYNTVMNRLHVPDKARLPFTLLLIFFIILLVAVILMLAFWPRTPGYLAAPLCLEKECLETSNQLLLWSNLSVDPCDSPYEYVCGKFEREYLTHMFYDMNEGEWNVKFNSEYNDVLDVNKFITQLPMKSASYSAHSHIKKLYESCLNLEMLEKSAAEVSLKKLISSIGGWNLDERGIDGAWDRKKALLALHSKHGIWPFYKISVKNRNSLPHGSIITVSLGEIGLPDELFYNDEYTSKIADSYKLLVRDFAINYGVVIERSRIFADEIFGFEKRIVKRIQVAKSSDEKPNQIISLGELKRKVPLLLIAETIELIYSHVKITDRTQILIENLGVLQEFVQLMSTTDDKSLNNFYTWSLVRHYLPFMSQDYRATLENFNRGLYSVSKTPPLWYYCSRLVHNWLNVGVDFLRFNPQLIATPSGTAGIAGSRTGRTNSSKLIATKVDRDHELAKLIYVHIRNEFINLLEKASWINQSLTDFLKTKLLNLRIHVGIPHDLLKDANYVDAYYNELMPQPEFMENLQERWNFIKRKQEQQLNKPNDTEKLVWIMYPPDESEFGNSKLVKFSIDSKLIVIEERAIRKPQFNWKYPISVNFARLGTELTESLLEAAFLFGEQFKGQMYSSMNVNITKSLTGSNIEGDSIDCIESYMQVFNTPYKVIRKLFSTVSAASITSKAFHSFLVHVDDKDSTADSLLTSSVDHESLGLKNWSRQPGLRTLNYVQLFTLSLLQKSCGTVKADYKDIKPYVEKELTQREIFTQIWDFVPVIRHSFYCPSRQVKCPSIF